MIVAQAPVQYISVSQLCLQVIKTADTGMVKYFLTVFQQANDKVCVKLPDISQTLSLVYGFKNTEVGRER